MCMCMLWNLVWKRSPEKTSWPSLTTVFLSENYGKAVEPVFMKDFGPWTQDLCCQPGISQRERPQTTTQLKLYVHSKTLRRTRRTMLTTELLSKSQHVSNTQPCSWTATGHLDVEGLQSTPKWLMMTAAVDLWISQDQWQPLKPPSFNQARDDRTPASRAEITSSRTLPHSPGSWGAWYECPRQICGTATSCKIMTTKNRKFDFRYKYDHKYAVWYAPTHPNIIICIT